MIMKKEDNGETVENMNTIEEFVEKWGVEGATNLVKLYMEKYPPSEMDRCIGIGHHVEQILQDLLGVLQMVPLDDMAPTLSVDGNEYKMKSAFYCEETETYLELDHGKPVLFKKG